MNYNFNVTNMDDTNVLFPSYYEYFTRIYGETFWSNVARVAMENGRFESRALAFLDDSYSHTKKTIESSNGEGPKIIAMKSAEGEDKGFFRIRFLTIENTNLACVAEVVLPNNYAASRVDGLKEMIGAIEAEVTTTCTDVDSLDFEVGNFDTDMQDALTDLGFTPLVEGQTRGNLTFMYEKQIRKQKSTRA